METDCSRVLWLLRARCLAPWFCLYSCSLAVLLLLTPPSPTLSSSIRLFFSFLQPAIIIDSGVIGETDCSLHHGGDSWSTEGYGGKTTSNKQLYTHTEDAERDGFIYDFVPMNKTEALRVIRSMQCDEESPVDTTASGGKLWSDDLVDRAVCVPFVDTQTAAMHVLIQVYNPNYNIFARMELTTEFAVTGNVENTVNFASATLDQSQDGNLGGTIISILLITAMAFEMIFWVQEIRMGAEHLFSFAALIDMFIHILSSVFIFDTVRQWLNITAGVVLVNLRNVDTVTGALMVVGCSCCGLFFFFFSFFL